jgi:hypothetical protein
LQELAGQEERGRRIDVSDGKPRPPDRAINEAIRRIASAGAGRQVDMSEVHYLVSKRGREVAIAVTGEEPDPLVYADVNRVLAIARNIANTWN